MLLWCVLSGRPTDGLPETVSFPECHRARASARSQSTHRRRHIPRSEGTRHSHVRSNDSEQVCEVQCERKKESYLFDKFDECKTLKILELSSIWFQIWKKMSETPQMANSARNKILIIRRNSFLLKPYFEINMLHAKLMVWVTLILNQPIITHTPIMRVSVSSAQSATRRIQARRCTLESSSSFRWERITKRPSYLISSSITKITPTGP